MARSILTDAERLAWESFPTDPDADVMGAYFTLADGEVDALRRRPTPAARLATAVALAAIRWLGFVPACLDKAPAAGAERLARQVDVDPAALDAYAPADRTAREHRQRAARLARFRDPRSQDLAALERLLVERALEHDSALGLLRAAVVELRDRRLLRPALSTLERLVASARAEAERETYRRLGAVLDGTTRRALDALCVTDVRLGVSRLVWLGREAGSAAPSQIVEQLDKLAFVRELGAERWRLEGVPANRRRQLAALARRSSSAALAGRTLERQSTQAHCLHLVSNAVIYWNTIYTQLALDDLQHEPASDELGGLTPTIFEHVNALGTYDFDTARPAGQLRPLRSTHAA